MSASIKVENISKAYQLGEFSTGTISQDLERWWALFRGKDDPFLMVGEENNRTQLGKSNIVWSLKDLSFEIEKGSVVGIIGRNGAGKSTLLKVLSQVTSPTYGKIKVKGRIASLLEVGTGFHPELTGRENIFLNGAILGMRKHEITRKFDEIVAFSGVERYIDTPVKRYSSGMYVRLAFAIAAHLESEILIIDEVLAVGDAEFQKKAIGKMQDVSKGTGRTVLFVSHNMGTILQLCPQSILLSQGRLEQYGSSVDVVESYYRKSNSNSLKNLSKNADAYYSEIYVHDGKGNEVSSFAFRETIYLRLKIEINKYDPIQNLGVVLLGSDKKRLFTVNKSLSDFYKSGIKSLEVDFEIKGGLFAPNDYSFLIALNNKTGIITFDWHEDVAPFKIYDDGTDLAFAEGINYGVIIFKDKWSVVDPNNKITQFNYLK
jgi:lipopolysaccharide transport system ATP-binding protein